ncbi:hypothetical protein FRC03_011267 [Tulasnella sp. 419]|nr:hypothetical protein FRC03_011267 [Tulasnella sp. 419]
MNAQAKDIRKLNTKAGGAPYGDGLHTQQCTDDPTTSYLGLLRRGRELSTQFEISSVKEDIDQAIECFHNALRMTPPSWEDKATTLYVLASAHQTRNKLWNDANDIGSAIYHFQQALQLLPSQHPLRSAPWNKLSACFLSRFHQLGDMQDLDEACRCYRETLSICSSGSPNRASLMNNLASCLRMRYDWRGAIMDLDDAITCHRDILLLRPPGHLLRARTLNNIANCFDTRRYQKQGDVEDLQKALEYHRDALSLRPPGHQDTSTSLSNLGNCLGKRYDQLGAIHDLEEAIQCNREALSLCAPNHTNYASISNNLANRLQTRFGIHGRFQDLEDAIRYHRSSLEAGLHKHVDRSRSLNNLANCLRARYKELGDSQDLAQAVQCHRESLELCPPGHPQRASTLHNLANCLSVHYEQSGSLQDLEESIQCHRDALLLRPFGHTSRFKTLIGLSHSLLAQYEQQSNLQDLQEAIRCNKEALSLCSAGHPDRSILLTDLATCLRARYHLQKDLQDLEEGIAHNEEALSLSSPSHSRQSILLNNLATCMMTRYEKLGNVEDFEGAVDNFQRALSSCPPGHPDRSLTLSNLGICFELQSKQQNNSHSLQRAIEYIKEAIANHPAAHPGLTQLWARLASLYADNSSLMDGSYRAGDITALFEMATNHKPASAKLRFKASRVWIKKEKGSSLLRAYEKALELADQYLLIRSSISSRHQLLPSIPLSLASDAAATAITTGDVKKAVEFLEQGRTLLWSQMGRYRTSLQALRNVDLELAQKFGKLSEQLEASTTTQTSEMSRLSMEVEARKYRQISDAWVDVVEKIRKLPDFCDFLLPPSFNDLRRAAEHGPVIIINISLKRCDAIVVRQNDDPLLIPLLIQQANVNKLSALFTEALESDKPSRKVIDILRCLWDDIAEPIVGKLQEIGIAQGSRIWWCPTANLTVLPLHAAGPYRRNKENLPDLYISSYTPTLSALVKSFQTDKCAAPRLLVIAQSDAPSQVEIPSVREELQVLEKVVPSMDMLSEENGTHAAVLAGLKTHSWVHITSHGSRNVEDPFQSSFHLYDKCLNLLDIIQAHLPNAEYAFLAACHSAAASRRMPDETLHLAASFQFAGFKSVIGTMYAMADLDGPILAEEVYKFMFRHIVNGEGKSNGVVSYTDAAKALNMATKVLRQKKVPVERWINFVHIGA